ncbi:putative tail assembly protein I [Pseudomonas phage UAntarctica]|nr:putative tail assembly protein I [Pseudomonas phage UAntarctica]
MKTFHLHGYAARYGSEFKLDIKDPSEAIRALSMQIDGFADMIREGEWFIFRGPLDKADSISEDELELGLGMESEFHLMPAIRGAGGGNGGIFSIVLGIVAIIAAPFTGGWSLAFYAAGAGMIVGGIIQMTMKVPGADTSTGESADSKASFLFSGPKNQSTQGVAIPRGYGRARSGSIVISAGLLAEKI